MRRVGATELGGDGLELGDGAGGKVLQHGQRPLVRRAAGGNVAFKPEGMTADAQDVAVAKGDAGDAGAVLEGAVAAAQVADDVARGSEFELAVPPRDVGVTEAQAAFLAATDHQRLGDPPPLDLSCSQHDANDRHAQVPFTSTQVWCGHVAGARVGREGCMNPISDERFLHTTLPGNSADVNRI